MKYNFSRLAAALLASAALAACGGGSGDTTSATQTKESVNGAITGFGSVIVEGERYEDTGARVQLEFDSTSPTDGSLDDLKLGMQVELESQDGVAQTVVVRAEVIASIESLATDGFTLAGQRVVVSTDTVYDGASSLADLVVGDWVEVHGMRDDAGNILATRIERKDPDLTRFYRVAGIVSGLDEQSFLLGDLKIVWDENTRVSPSIDALADGLRVAVWANTAPQAGTLTARAIRVRANPNNDTLRIRIGGPIRNLDFEAKTFNLHRFMVDAAQAKFTNGQQADLANGRWVRVRGTVQLNDAGKRVVSASEVRFKRDLDDDNSVLGPISNYAGPASFTVRGVPVDASADNVQFEGGDVTNLANGVIIKVEGSVNGNVLVASEVKFVDTEISDRRSVAGIVRDYDETAGTFFVFGVAMQLRAETIYLNGDGTDASVADLNTGDAVYVTGFAENGVFQVLRLVMRNGSPIVIDDEIKGAIYNVDLDNGVFHINRSIIRLDGQTIIEGVRENLRNGARLEVHVRIVNGQLIATRIEYER